MERQFDQQLMLDRLGGDSELLLEVVQLFVEECPQMIAQVSSAVSEADPTTLHQSAHALKGALLNIGAEPAAGIARELEKRGRGDSLDGVDQLFEALESSLNRLTEELSALTT